MSKLMGIDFGSKRVGIALSDDTGSIAFPKAILPNNRRLLEAVVALVREEGVGTIVIGESKHFTGEDNAIMDEIRRFITGLEKETDARIVYEPEFYTSVEARRESGEGSVDDKAAAIILNSFIMRTKK